MAKVRGERGVTLAETREAQVRELRREVRTLKAKLKEYEAFVLELKCRAQDLHYDPDFDGISPKLKTNASPSVRYDEAFGTI